ncbi:MAG: TIGR02646 family protein, partial [Nitrospirota bacterium]
MIISNGNGEIYSEDTVINIQINSVLNLNYALLKLNRKNVSDGIFDSLNNIQGPITKRSLNNWLKRWSNKNSAGY